MNQIALVKQQVRLNEWADQIRDRVQSGMTVSEWCEAHDICIKTYYYRLKKVRAHMLSELPDDQMPSDQNGVTFRKLEVKAPSNRYQPAVIVHLDRAVLEVPEGISRNTMEAVLGALKSTC